MWLVDIRILYSARAIRHRLPAMKWHGITLVVCGEARSRQGAVTYDYNRGDKPNRISYEYYLY